MEYVLETRALQKRYRSFAALDGCTMHVPKGAIYGFVGRNGAGKTTLIRLICGLHEPSAGSYTLFGGNNTDARALPQADGCGGRNAVHLSRHDGGRESPPAVPRAGRPV